jgi:hypothetical protein
MEIDGAIAVVAMYLVAPNLEDRALRTASCDPSSPSPDCTTNAVSLCVLPKLKLVRNVLEY